MSKSHLAVAAAVVCVALTPPGRHVLDSFTASLRIDKPKAVTASLGNPTASNRPMQDAIAGMLTATPHLTIDEPEQALGNATEAARYLGFTPALVAARKDSVTFIGVGARSVDLPIDRAALRSILDQAGEATIATPESLQGRDVIIRVPRAVRAQYGNCPAAAAATLQAQLQGPPPPTTENGNCIVLFQSKLAAAEAPGDLAIDRLATIAYELAGMSANQVVAFQRVTEWRGATVLALPRGMRSYDTLSVRGAPAMLINTGGRRGPTYALVWQRNDVVFALSGYGNAGDAKGLAESVQ